MEKRHLVNHPHFSGQHSSFSIYALNDDDIRYLWIHRSCEMLQPCQNVAQLDFILTVEQNAEQSMGGTRIGDHLQSYK